MILLFSDGYKEITQPLLMDDTRHPELIDRFLKAITPPLTPAERETLEPLVAEYLQYLTWRFQYHVKHIEEVGDLIPKVNRNIRKLSERCAIHTANSLQQILNFFKDTNRLEMFEPTLKIRDEIMNDRIPKTNYVSYYPHGSSIIHNKLLFNLINMLFGINKKYISHSFKKNAAAYYVALKEETTNVGHAIGVFKCNGKYYFYDDNAPILIRIFDDSEEEIFNNEDELKSKVEKFFEVENNVSSAAVGGTTDKLAVVVHIISITDDSDTVAASAKIDTLRVGSRVVSRHRKTRRGKTRRGRGKTRKGARRGGRR